MAQKSNNNNVLPILPNIVLFEKADSQPTRKIVTRDSYRTSCLWIYAYWGFFFFYTKKVAEYIFA